MSPPEDAAAKVARLRSVPLRPDLDGISDEALREHVAQTSARLEAVVGAIDKLVAASAEQSGQIGLLTGAVQSLEITVQRNATATSQRLDALARAVVEVAERGRKRDAEIEKRAEAASTKASGVRQALQSHQDLEAERREAERLARALEAERDRRRDEEVAELRRRQDAIAAREAEYALAARQGAAIAKDREDKVSLKGALGGAGATQIVTTIIAAMQGQALTYAIGIGLGLGLTVVLFALVIRHFRKASK